MTAGNFKMLTLLFGCLILPGCAVGVGAATAVVADEIAEERGGNLF